VFTRYVEVGRVAVITYGPFVNEPVVIVDIVDQARALIHPLKASSKLERDVYPFKRLHLTSLKVEKLPRGCASKVVAKAVAKSDTLNKWAQSSFAKKQVVREKRASMNDFDRFKMMLAKKTRRSVVFKKVNELRKH
jgi:large subunit ribosomal protein L14e